MLSLYLQQEALNTVTFVACWWFCLPLEIDCLDDKSQGWTDSIDVFVHDFLHNRRFTCIV